MASTILRWPDRGALADLYHPILVEMIGDEIMARLAEVGDERRVAIVGRGDIVAHTAHKEQSEDEQRD